jgi:tetratricopeptide (TPR) repeat protein
MLAVFTALARAHPEEPAYQLGMAQASARLGETLRGLARHEEAEQHFARAGELAARLVARHPEVAAHHDTLIIVRFDQASGAFAAGKLEQALALLQGILDLHRQRNQLHPVTPDSRASLATVQMKRSVAYQLLKRYQEALAPLEASRDAWQKLAEEFPSNRQLQVELAHVWSALGGLYDALHRPSDADAAYRESVWRARTIGEQFRTLPSCRIALAQACHNQAFWLIEQNQRQEAAALFQEAGTLLESLVAEFPAIGEYKVELGIHYTARASRFFMRDFQGALALADRAVQLTSEGFAAEPWPPRNRRALVEALLLRAKGLASLDRFDEAVRTLDRATALEPGVEQEYAVFSLAARWGAKQQMVPALGKASARKHAEAAQAANALVEKRLLGAAAAFSANNPLTGINALVVARDFAQREGPVGDTFYNAACVFARCAKVAEKDAPELVAVYADRAMALLARARDEAYFAGAEGRKLLTTDHDLDPLRQRQDFQKLLASVRALAPPR